MRSGRTFWISAMIGKAGDAPASGCEDADVIRDYDVEQDDFTVFFNNCISGTNVPYVSDCAG